MVQHVVILNGIFRVGLRDTSDIWAGLNEIPEGFGHMKIWRQGCRLREQSWRRPQTEKYYIFNGLKKQVSFGWHRL